MIMGLPFSVHLRADVTDDVERFDAELYDAVVNRVWDRLRQADAVFSTYRSDSDISRIGRGELAVADADPVVAEVLDLAAVAERITGGTFDIRAAGTLDPSGIVKAWAASRAAEELTCLAVDHYLNAGGDVLLRSLSTARPWRIGIEHPDNPQGLLAVVEAASGAVATSGRSHRGGHITDPATGAPAHGIAQVTVVGPSLIWSDVLATAVVAGGLDRLDRGQWPPGHEVLLVTDWGEVLGSTGFSRFLAPDLPAPAFTALP